MDSSDINIILNDFIDRAQKSRKYMLNTATNFKTPLRLMVSELSEEEKNSIELVKKNLDQIFTSIYNKNSSKFSAASIEVYKRRIRNLISDYERYGTSPAAMANWSRPIVTWKLKNRSGHQASEKESELSVLSPSLGLDPSLTKHEETLTHGKAIIFTPFLLTNGDITILRAYINYLETKIPKEKKIHQIKREG